MRSERESFYTEKKEPKKSRLLTLRDIIILKQDHNIGVLIATVF